MHIHAQVSPKAIAKTNLLCKAQPCTYYVYLAYPYDVRVCISATLCSTRPGHNRFDREKYL